MATGPPEQLPVDTGGLMIFRQNDMEPTGFLHVAMKLDIGPPARHVGRNGYAAWLSGFGDDVRFQAILPGVENDRIEPGFSQ